MISPFREDFIFTKLRKNKTFAKITEITVVLETGIDMLESVALTHLSRMDFFQYYQLDKSISVLRVVG